MQTAENVRGGTAVTAIFLYSAQTVKDESSCMKVLALFITQQLSAEGATVSGHTLILPPVPSASVSLTLAAGRFEL
jgi:hypothetical protein